jgi:hypothetical protein
LASRSDSKRALYDKEKSLMSVQKIYSLIILFAVSTLLSALLLFNHIFPLDSLHRGIKPDDPALMVWNMFVVNESLKQFKNPLTTDMIFYPEGANLAHHALISGFAPISFLADKITGGSVYYPFYAYHIAIWLSFTLLLFFSYLVLRELGYNGFAAIIPAVAYSFCSFYMTHIQGVHLNLIGFCIPLTAFFIVRLYELPSLKNAIFTSTALALSIYFTEFSLFIYLTIIILLIICLTLKHQRQIVISKIADLGIARIAVMIIIFSLITAPFVSKWLHNKVEKPLVLEYFAYSANPIDFFIPHPESTPLYGSIFSFINSDISSTITGHEVFIGFPLLLLGIYAMFVSKKRHVRIAFGISLVFFILSLGPALKVLNGISNLYLPYYFLMKLPLFVEFRTPVRFVVFGMFFMMIVGAEGTSALNDRLSKIAGRHISLALMSIVMLWTIAESYKPSKRLESFKIPQQLSQVVEGAGLNLPIIFKDGYAAMLQVIHKQPIVTGYVARLSENNMKQYKFLKQLFIDLPDNLCAELKSLGYKNIILSDGITKEAVDAVSKCGINIVDIRTNK